MSHAYGSQLLFATDHAPGSNHPSDRSGQFIGDGEGHAIIRPCGSTARAHDRSNWTTR